jgi:hypothetical protein
MKNFSLKTKRHAFHLVDPSAAPFLTAVSALTLTGGSVFYFHGFSFGVETSFLGAFGVTFCMFL